MNSVMFESTVMVINSSQWTVCYTLSCADFEADLQEVWSVRKNIHHTGKSLPKLATNGVQVTGQYSRHGAIPAQQTQGPQTLSSKDALNKGGTCVNEHFAFKFAMSCTHGQSDFQALPGYPQAIPTLILEPF